MRFITNLIKAAIAGAVSGTLLLGIAFRLITLGIAYSRSIALNLSLHNIAEVLVLSFIIGVLGGILFSVMHELFKTLSLKIKGVISAAVLFAVLYLVQVLRGLVQLTLLPLQFSMFLLTFAIFLLYGLFMAILARHLFSDQGDQT